MCSTYIVILSLSLRNIWLRVYVIKFIACQTRYFAVNNDIAFCYYPVNTKHLYNICTMLDQRLGRLNDVVQMLCKCFVFAGYEVNSSFNYGPHAPSPKADAPPSEKYHGPLGPLFPIYKSGTEYVIVPTSHTYSFNYLYCRILKGPLGIRHFQCCQFRKFNSDEAI